MDLDQLKDIWKELDEPAGGPQSKQQITAMLKKRSQGPIAKMKRNLRWELIIVLVSYPILITHFFLSYDQESQAVAWFLLVVAGLIFFYFYKKNKLLNEMQQVSGNVKIHLERRVKTLEQFIRVYLVAGVAMAPICLAFFGWIFYNEVSALSTRSIFYTSANNPLWKAVLAWIILTIALTVPVYFANVWILKKLYINHIKKLKLIVREMSEE
jgi:hypothetical protein